MKTSSSRKLWLSVVGALLGDVLATWLGPKVIVWWNEPPAQLGFTCKPSVEWALRQFQISQLTGIVFGALLGLVASITLLRRKNTPEATL